MSVRMCLLALACFGLSVAAMAADTAWVPNQAASPVATYLAALIFVPLALSAYWSLLALLNLAVMGVAAMGRWLEPKRPDYGRIAELEREAGITAPEDQP